MTAARWSAWIALRNFVEILLVLAFIVIVPPLVEAGMQRHGFAMAGTTRIIGTAVLQLLLAGFAALLLILTREPFSAIGLGRPRSISRTVLQGLLVAACIFAVVVTLEHFGYGRNRLGDTGRELKGNWTLLAERVAISLLVVGFVEEFIFRGFLMSRIAGIFGGGRWAWIVALVLQAALFGLSHGYQQLYGMALTGAIGLFLGSVYLLSGRNLWVPVIGHGVYDAAHAVWIAGVLGNG
jgi:membrane protease YdiL (CAAX protease family)